MDRVQRDHGDPDVPCTELTLFVSGASDLSARAIAQTQQLCEHLESEHHLTVVDVHEDPAAFSGRVVATPTLVKDWPLPVRKIVGDLSNTNKVLLALGLSVTQEANGSA